MIDYLIFIQQYRTQGSDTTFTCHHGPSECFGNKIQSCAIKLIEVDSYQKEHTKDSLTLEYINCLMNPRYNFQDSIYPGRKCAEELNLKKVWELIDQCANSTDGSTYLRQNGEKTEALQPPLTSVPTIVFREHFEQDFQDEAIKDFRMAVCTRLTPKPIECAAGGGASGNTAAFLVTLASFVVSRFF